MSYVNNQLKKLVNEAIHNHFHDKTETEMILKDWLYGICEQLDEYEAKVEAFDAILKSYDESYSNSHLGDEVVGIIQKHTESRSDSDER